MPQRRHLAFGGEIDGMAGKKPVLQSDIRHLGGKRGGQRGSLGPVEIFLGGAARDAAAFGDQLGPLPIFEMES